MSRVVASCRDVFLVFKHCSKTAHSSKSSKHAGVGLQIPCHLCSSICYLIGITKKLERCASVILKLTSGLKENICLECLMRSDVIFETKCPSIAFLNEHVDCLNACAFPDCEQVMPNHGGCRDQGTGALWVVSRVHGTKVV